MEDAGGRQNQMAAGGTTSVERAECGAATRWRAVEAGGREGWMQEAEEEMIYSLNDISDCYMSFSNVNSK